MKINGEMILLSFRENSEWKSTERNPSNPLRAAVRKKISEANRLKRKKVRNFLSLQDKAFAGSFEFGGLSYLVKKNFVIGARIEN